MQRLTVYWVSPRFAKEMSECSQILPDIDFTKSIGLIFAISSELARRKEIAERFKATAIPPLNSSPQSTPKINDFSGTPLEALVS